MPTLTESDAQKAKEQESKKHFEDFKEKYNAVDKFYTDTMKDLNAVLASGQLTPRDKDVIETFKFQHEMVCKLALRSLVFEFRLDLLDDYVQKTLSTVLTNTILKLNSKFLNLTDEMATLRKTAINSEDFADVRAFVNDFTKKKEDEKKKMEENDLAT